MQFCTATAEHERCVVATTARTRTCSRVVHTGQSNNPPVFDDRVHVTDVRDAPDVFVAIPR